MESLYEHHYLSKSTSFLRIGSFKSHLRNSHPRKSVRKDWNNSAFDHPNRIYHEITNFLSKNHWKTHGVLVVNAATIYHRNQSWGRKNSRSYCWSQKKSGDRQLIGWLCFLSPRFKSYISGGWPWDFWTINVVSTKFGDFLLLQVDSPYQKNPHWGSSDITLSNIHHLDKQKPHTHPPGPLTTPPSQDFQRHSWHCPWDQKKWSSNNPNLVGGFNPFEKY